MDRRTTLSMGALGAMILLAFGSTDSTSMTGTKGNWSAFIKSNFMSGCMAERPNEITEEQMNELCECSMNRIEERYAPEDLETAAAQQFAEQAGTECAMDMFAG